MIKFVPLLVGSLAVLLSACGGGDDESSSSPPAPTTIWQAGPTIGLKGNYSAGTVVTEAGDTVMIDIPQAPQSAHYITRAMSLVGASRICMDYRVDMGDGVKIVPLTAPGGPSMLSLYFQRAGDDWMVNPKTAAVMEAYRWYSPEIDMPITAGEHRICAGLDENWTAVETSSAHSNPTEFQAAIAHSARVGFVLGGGSGRGHGVYAVGGPARIVVTSFEAQ